MMKKHLIIPILILAILTVASVSLTQPYTGVRLVTTMTGTEEANGDPDGYGYAEFSLNYGLSQVCWNITYGDIGTGSASHIHYAPPGSSGAPVVFISPINSGCKTVDRSVILAIIQDPQSYYLNVHTAAYPAGAIRGQLSNAGLSE